MKPSFRLGFATRVRAEIHNLFSMFNPAQSSARGMRVLDGPRRLTLHRHARSMVRHLGLLLLVGAGVTNAQGAIGFVQVNSAVPQTPQTTVSVTYTKAQTVGDLNVVVIGWSNSTGQINSVVDSKGNAYVLAVGPTVQSGVATQAIYYASNIAAAAASANAVTVTFSTAVTFPDIRIAEYSGIVTASPVDVVAAAQGSSTSASSGSVTTKNANDLLVGADKVKTVTTAAGSGYTSRTITSPNGDILEDRTVTATGSYSATATLYTGSWIMQMVAFQAAASGGGTTPAITNLSPNSGPAGASVTITGNNFGTTGTVTFNGTTATPTSWSATSIVTPVPANATTGNVVVTAGGVASNGITFTVPASTPNISSLNPTSGPIGASVTITGTNFGTSQGTSTVTFNGTTATPTSWSAGSIVVPVPSTSTTGNVVVTVSGVASNGESFTVTSTAAISFVQVNSATPQTTQTAVSVTFASAQSAGDLNVVAVSWEGSAQITSVADGSGNTYALAVGPTAETGPAAEAIYYAKKIAGAAANANSVTVTFSSAATYPDVRIAEYQGLDPGSPLDVSVAAVGSSTAASSGSVTTTSANDLLVGADWTKTLTTAAGTSFTKRIITNPDGDLLEDRIVSATGSYSATATISPSGLWIMQMVAFRAAGTIIDTTPPAVSISSPASGATVSGTISVTANASDNVGVASVQFQIDNTNVGSLLTTAPYSYSWNTASASNGSHSVRAIAKDAAGNTSTSAGATVTVNNSVSNSDTLPPTVSITSPASGATVSGTISVTANAADDVSVASVQFQLDSANVGSLITTAPYSYSWNTTTATNGSHTLGAIATDVGGHTTTSAGVSVTVSNSVTSYVLPLKASANNRYLIDQNGTPFLLMGDAAHSLVANVSSSDMTLYMSTRSGQGFNAIQVFALCDTYETGCPSTLDSYSGVPPFTSGSSQSNYDLSTPNPAYWTIVDNMIALAASYHLTVFLDPLDTGGLLPLAETNGTTKMYNYGVFLGNRYKNTPNLAWDFGNDFQDWNSNSTDNNLILQLMKGIASVDPSHLMDIELNYYDSYSDQDTALSSALSFDGAYTYYETYDEVLNAYNSSPTLPVFMQEANYEFENDSNFYSGVAGAFMLREQEYWTATSGATGQLYGSHYTNHFISGWQSNLATPGAIQTAYVTQLFRSYPWWNLVPDQTHQIITSGYGTYNGSNANLTLANYVTTAWVPDGSLAIAYDPAGNALTVNLAKFNSPVTAGWYDPSNGTFTVIAGSPFTNSRSYQFVPKGLNNGGDKDWVLVLEVNPITP